MDGHRGGGGGGLGGALPSLQYTPRSSSSSRNLGRCSACCSRLASALCSNLGVCALVLLYTVAGAFVFTTLEGGDMAIQVDPPREAAVMDSLRGLRNETIELLWNATEKLNILYRENWTMVAEQELLKFSEKLLRLREPPSLEPSTSHTSYQWTFAGSFLYSLTVITTIGYGSVAPQTVQGRVVTIVYALLGIPIMLLYLSSVGDLLSRALKWIWWRLCRCSRRRHKTPPPPNTLRQTPTPYTNVDPPKRKWGGDCNDGNTGEEYGEGEGGAVPVTLCLLLMVSYICGGAAAFAYAHDWSFLQAVYFCFSSLTTIGFGDLVPNTTPNINTGVQVALLGAAFYLLVGMALIATCFNLMQEQMTNRGYGLGKRLGNLMAPNGTGANHRFHLDDT